MSSRRDNYGSSSYNDDRDRDRDSHSHGHGPPPLRQPNLSSAQVLAAVKLGFSDKHNNYSSGGGGSNHGSSNGRGNAYHTGNNDNSGFPEIGQFSAEDYVDSGTQAQSQPQRQNNSYNQHDDRTTQQYPGQGQGDEGQGQEEGLLPPLRRPHTHEIPADVLAVLLKEKSFEEVLVQSQSPQNQLNQHVPQTPDRSNHSTLTSTSTPPPPTQSPQSQTPGGRNNNSVYYQSRTSTPLNRPPSQQGYQQSPRTPVPQHHTPGASPRQRFEMLQQSTPRSNYSSSPRPDSSSSSAGRQSSVRVQLSASAKEFVPSTPNRNPGGGGGGEPDPWTTQEESELAQAVAQFQLHHHHDQPQPDLIDFNQGAYASQPSYGYDASYADDTSDYVLSTMTDSISDLTNHPANFARVAKGVTEVLKNFCFDLDTLTVAVSLLVEQSISNPNFCYSGARLAEALVKNKIAVNNMTFKKILLMKCQEEFESCKAKMQSDPQIMIRCRGLLMFFAELWMNIKMMDVNSGLETPIKALGLGVLEMMENLVKDPSHDNIKSIFQVLKLVGWDLENSPVPEIPTSFEKLLKDMSFLCMASGSIKPETKFLLDTLFELKNKKWNREDPVSAGISPATSSTSSSTNTGTPNIYELPDSDDDYDDDDCILIDDESEEVQRAYEDFLNSTK